MDMCEKICKAIFCCSDNSRLPVNPAEKTAPPNGNGNIRRNGQMPRLAPEMEHVSATAPAKELGNPRTDMGQPGKEVAPGRVQLSKIGPEVTQVNKEQGKKTGIHIEDRFTDYINRAKTKIRTVSMRDRNSEKGKDGFSDYIDRAKVKLRTASSFGGDGRRQSFK